MTIVYRRKINNRKKKKRLRDFSPKDQSDEKLKTLKPFLYAQNLAESQRFTNGLLQRM